MHKILVLLTIYYWLHIILFSFLTCHVFGNFSSHLGSNTFSCNIFCIQKLTNRTHTIKMHKTIFLCANSYAQWNPYFAYAGLLSGKVSFKRMENLENMLRHFAFDIFKELFLFKPDRTRIIARQACCCLFVSVFLPIHIYYFDFSVLFCSLFSFE